MKKRISSIVSPFVGNGKLTQYKDKKDSWIYNQIQKEKVNPAINVNDDNYIKFSSIKNRMAVQIISSCDNICIKKYYSYIPNDFGKEPKIALRWVLQSDINGSSVDQVNLVANFLQYKMDYDVQYINRSVNGCLGDMDRPYIEPNNGRMVVRCTYVDFEKTKGKFQKMLLELGFIGVN